MHLSLTRLLLLAPSSALLQVHTRLAKAILHKAKVDAMQQREALSLQEQEKDLLRAFRARLYDVQIELERERSNWMRRATAAEMQLETLNETLGDNLGKYQKSLLKLQKQMRAQGVSDAAIRQAADEDGIELAPPSPERGDAQGQKVQAFCQG